MMYHMTVRAGTHWRQSRIQTVVRHSGDKNCPLSTESTELNMINFWRQCRPQQIGDKVESLRWQPGRLCLQCEPALGNELKVHNRSFLWQSLNNVLLSHCPVHSVMMFFMLYYFVQTRDDDDDDDDDDGGLVCW